MPESGIQSGRISALLVEVGAGEVGKDDGERVLGSLHLRNAMLISLQTTWGRKRRQSQIWQLVCSVCGFTEPQSLEAPSSNCFYWCRDKKKLYKPAICTFCVAQTNDFYLFGFVQAFPI